MTIANSITLDELKARGKKAKGRAKDDSGMTKIERDFDARLKNALAIRAIEWYCYEGMRFRLGFNNNYTPDFCVMENDGSMVFYECKGSWNMKNARDSKTKIKTAASMFWMFRFVAVTREKGEWKFEEIKP